LFYGFKHTTIPEKAAILRIDSVPGKRILGSIVAQSGKPILHIGHAWPAKNLGRQYSLVLHAQDCSVIPARAGIQWRAQRADR
jgi:hypothetical protein